MMSQLIAVGTPRVRGAPELQCTLQWCRRVADKSSPPGRADLCSQIGIDGLLNDETDSAQNGQQQQPKCIRHGFSLRVPTVSISRRQ
jgi:hypothetical protein